MLKQLRLNIQLEQEKRKLAAILEQEKGFNTRKSDLEKRLEAAATAPDADIEKINSDLTELEKEVGEADIEKKKTDIEAEITRIENELKEIGKPAADPAPGTGNERKGENFNMERKATSIFNIRTRLAPLVERSEVKDWLTQLRAFGKGESRAITGAELNIPEVILEPLRELVAQKSKLMKYVNYKPIKGRARQPIVGAVPEAVWMECIADLNELSFGFNMVEADAYKIGGFIPVPNSTLEDSDINLFVEITSMLGASLAYGVDKAIMYGEGVKMPLGIITRLKSATAVRDMGKNAPTWKNLSTSHIKALSSASLTAVEIFSEMAVGLGVAKSKYAAGGKFWAMSEVTWAKMQSLFITINAQGAIVSGMSMQMPVIGGDIVLLDFMPDNVIAGGYGELYLLAEREGGAIEKSEHVKFLQDNTVFRGTARYDGLPVDGEAFAMFTLATTSGATVQTFVEDTANPSHAYLTALSLADESENAISISPEFDRDTLAYTATVANAVDAAIVNATARTYGSIVSIKNGTTTATNGAVELAVGENTITIVTKYGTSKRTYTIKVTRAGTGQ